MNKATPSPENSKIIHPFKEIPQMQLGQQKHWQSSTNGMMFQSEDQFQMSRYIGFTLSLILITGLLLLSLRVMKKKRLRSQ